LTSRVLSRPPVPLGAYVRGFSAIVVLQVCNERLPQLIRQLQADPNVDSGYAAELRATWRDIQAAAQMHLDWQQALPDVTSADAVPNAAGSDFLRPPPRDSGWAAERLQCSERWVRHLCVTGRLSALKKGGRWWVDPASVEVYLEAERGAAA
jgi:hypothetical protein